MTHSEFFETTLTHPDEEVLVIASASTTILLEL
jgi:hypothetical protein